MLCEICLNGLEGIWDPARTPRLALRAEFDIQKRTKVEKEEDEDAETHKKRSGAESYIFGHHKTLQSFIDSQGKGCVMCNRYRPTQSDEDPDILGYFSVFTVLLKENPIMSVYYGNSLGGFGLVPVTEDKNLQYTFGPTNHGPQTMTTIQSWLEDCVQNHKRCRTTSSPSSLPARLLAFNQSEFRLVERSEVTPVERYAIVTYDSGEESNAERLQLNKASYEYLRNEHPISSLPKTFRDAMGFASSLGLHYIWIDRFCIYQDSHEDWLAQYASVGEIYANCYLNISALGANDEQEGLYFERNPVEIGPTIVQIKRDIDSEIEKFRFRFEKNWGWRLSFEKEPLAQRAWAVQERLLCPRVVHFGRKQVFWECRQRSACEVQPETVYDYDEGESKTEKPHLWKQLLNAPDRRQMEDPYLQLFVDWNAVLYTYSRCIATKSSDKLVAISRLAGMMRQALDSIRPGSHNYFAGHWEDMLLESLTWNVLGPAKRVQKYRAPSWSWASVEGSINFGLHFPKEEQTIRLATCHECITEPAGDDDTGAVKGGWITLMTPLLVLHVDSEPPVESFRLNERQVKEIVVPEDGAAVILGDSRKDGFPNPRVIFEDMDDIQETVFCAPIKANHWYQGKYSASGLVLVKSLGEGENTYRRVGIWSHNFTEKDAVPAFFGDFKQHEIKII